jgi:hypothetical protein
MQTWRIQSERAGIGVIALRILSGRMRGFSERVIKAQNSPENHEEVTSEPRQPGSIIELNQVGCSPRAMTIFPVRTVSMILN